MMLLQSPVSPEGIAGNAVVAAVIFALIKLADKAIDSRNSRKGTPRVPVVPVAGPDVPPMFVHRRSSDDPSFNARDRELLVTQTARIDALIASVEALCQQVDGLRLVCNELIIIHRERSK